MTHATVVRSWIPMLAIPAILLGASTGLALENTAPLERAHSHNDYSRVHPLLDALDAGFCSIEADIFLIKGELLVAHHEKEIKPGNTLQKLYLDPLLDRVRRNHGRVYPNGPVVTLLIDFKTEPEDTWPKLREVLEHYREMLTVFTNEGTEAKAVSVILSGASPRKQIAAEASRLAAIDGRLGDIETAPSPNLVPLISENWPTAFKWFGKGPMPEAERTKLRELVTKTHAHGQRIRFYGTPQSLEFWSELYEAGVDLLNADNLPKLRDFLRSKQHAS